MLNVPALQLRHPAAADSEAVPAVQLKARHGPVLDAGGPVPALQLTHGVVTFKSSSEVPAGQAKREQRPAEAAGT